MQGRIKLVVDPRKLLIEGALEEDLVRFHVFPHASQALHIEEVLKDTCLIGKATLAEPVDSDDELEQHEVGEARL